MTGRKALDRALALALTLSLGAVFAMPSLPVCAATLPEADELLLQNKLKQAEEAYRELLSDDQTGDAYAGLAVSLAKQIWPVKILEAEKLLKKAKEKFADNPNVQAAAGYVSYVHSKNVASPAKRDLYLEAAEKLCKKALAQNDGIVIAQQTLGLVKMAQDDPEGAILPLRQAADLANNFVNLTLLAQALLKVDNKDKEAIELVNKALQLKADYGPAHLQKAIALSGQGKQEDAFMELHNIPNDPLQRSSEWHTTEGNIFRKQGDGPSALQAWNKASMEDPRNPEPYRRKAEYYVMRGDGELAIGEYHNGLDILPNDFGMRADLAELALRQDKLDVAEAEFKTILEAKPDDPKAMLGLARCGFRKYRKEGTYPPNFNQLMDRLQNIITEQTVQGKVLKDGEVSKGARDLNERIELSEASKALTEGQFRAARQKYLEVIEKHHEEPYELVTLGEQCLFEGDYKAAEKAFAYAKELPEVSTRAEQGMNKINNQRNEASRHVRLGDASWKIPEIAVDHYKQGLAADPQCPGAYYGLFSLFSKSEKQDPGQAVKYGLCFLEASDDGSPLRREVETSLVKLKKRVSPTKGK